MAHAINERLSFLSSVIELKLSLQLSLGQKPQGIFAK